MQHPDPTRTVVDGKPWWLFADGTLIPVVSGGDGDPDPDPDPNADPDPDPDPPVGSLEELLADVDEEKRKAILAEVAKPRNEAKGLRTRLKAATSKAAQFDALVASTQTEAERQAAAVTAAEAKAAEASSRIARAEVKALASATFTDAEDAVAFLDLSTYVDDDGEVDTDAIKTDLDDLLKRKPHLGRGDKPAPRPDRSQGSGANGTRTQDPKDEWDSWAKTALENARS